MSTLVRPGYQQTEVGVIPRDWAMSPLEEFTSFISYGFTNPMPIADSGVYMVTAKDINKGKIQFDTARCTTDDAYRNLLTAKSRPKNGDLLLTKDGTLGRLAIVDNTTVCINQSVAILRPNSKAVPLFLKILLEAPEYQRRMIEDAGGSTIKHIYITIVNRMLIGLPPNKAEQEAIAEALGDTDALIDSLEQLLAKKRNIKQGTMQELLTGAKRLPGFQVQSGYKKTELGDIPCDWETISIARGCRKIIDYRGRTPRKLGMDWGGGDIPALSAGNVKMGYIDLDHECYLGSEALYKRWMTTGEAAKDDVVVTLEAPLGNVALIPDERKYILSQRTVLLQLDTQKTSSLFLFQVMISERFQRLLSENATGSTAQGIQRKKFETLTYACPTIPEQEAIAAILSEMDSEIAELETQLSKTRDLKQGMMHKLLTGEIRLL